MSEQKINPNVLPPEISSRNLPARQPLGPASLGDPNQIWGYIRSENVKLRHLWQIIRKRFWLVTGIAVITTVVVTLDQFRNKPLYQATASIEIGRDSGMRVRSNEVLIDDEDQLYVTMNTAEVALKSGPLLEDVVVQLQLDKNPAFLDITSRKSLSESLHDVVERIGRSRTPARPAVFTSTPVEVKSSGSRSPEEVEWLTPYVRIVEDSLRIQPILGTRVMTLAYTHTDPLLASSITNTVAQRFVETRFQQKIEKFTSASEWLDRSTRELKAKVEHAEQALADYTKTHNIYGLENKTTLTTEKLSKLHDQVTRAETDRILKESLHEQVLQGRITQIPEAFADTQTVDLQKKLDELSIKAAELSATYGPKYPQIAQIKHQMAEVRD